jgi:hypothetical protein
MEKLKKIQKEHHYIVDWHIPKKNKEDIKDIQSKQIKPINSEKISEKEIKFFWY